MGPTTNPHHQHLREVIRERPTRRGQLRPSPCREFHSGVRRTSFPCPPRPESSRPLPYRNPIGAKPYRATHRPGLNSGIGITLRDIPGDWESVAAVWTGPRSRCASWSTRRPVPVRARTPRRSPWRAGRCWCSSPRAAAPGLVGPGSSPPIAGRCGGSRGVRRNPLKGVACHDQRSPRALGRRLHRARGGLRLHPPAAGPRGPAGRRSAAGAVVNQINKWLASGIGKIAGPVGEWIGQDTKEVAVAIPSVIGLALAIVVVVFLRGKGTGKSAAGGKSAIGGKGAPWWRWRLQEELPTSRWPARCCCRSSRSLGETVRNVSMIIFDILVWLAVAKIAVLLLEDTVYAVRGKQTPATRTAPPPGRPAEDQRRGTAQRHAGRRCRGRRAPRGRGGGYLAGLIEDATERGPDAAGPPPASAVPRPSTASWSTSTSRAAGTPTATCAAGTAARTGSRPTPSAPAGSTPGPSTPTSTPDSPSPPRQPR